MKENYRGFTQYYNPYKLNQNTKCQLNTYSPSTKCYPTDICKAPKNNLSRLGNKESYSNRVRCNNNRVEIDKGCPVYDPYTYDDLNQEYIPSGSNCLNNPCWCPSTGYYNTPTLKESKIGLKFRPTTSGKILEGNFWPTPETIGFDSTIYTNSKFNYPKCGYTPCLQARANETYETSNCNNYSGVPSPPAGSFGGNPKRCCNGSDKYCKSVCSNWDLSGEKKINYLCTYPNMKICTNKPVTKKWFDGLGWIYYDFGIGQPVPQDVNIQTSGDLNYIFNLEYFNKHIDEPGYYESLFKPCDTK